jgi:hypothetical protein
MGDEMRECCEACSRCKGERGCEIAPSEPHKPYWFRIEYADIDLITAAMLEQLLNPDRQEAFVEKFK